MRGITFKVGLLILGLSVSISLIVILLIIILGVAGEGADTEINILKILHLLLSLSVVSGVLSLLCGLLNKFKAINIGWIFFVLICLLLGVTIWISFGGFEPMTGRWAHFKGGGCFIGGKPRITPDNSKVIFSDPITGHGDIYIMNSDGSARNRLTFSDDFEGFPFISPDGTKICYEREENGKGRIYIMDIDGKNQRRLTYGAIDDSEPVFTSDSKKIIFWRFIRPPRLRGYRIAYIINIDGSGVYPLIDNKIRGEHLVLSQDGGDIYYFNGLDESERVGIWKKDIVSGVEEFISTIPIDNPVEFEFSHDLSKIIFGHYSEAQKGYQISIMRIDGTLIKHLTDLPRKITISYASLSFDNTKILFLIETGPRCGLGNIMLMNNDGSDLRVVGTNY